MRFIILTAMLTAGVLAAGCDDDDGTNGAGGDADADGDVAGDADSDTDSDSDSDTDSDGDTDTGYENIGLCKVYGVSTANQGALEGIQEYYLVADKGLGDELCRVRFDLRTAGELPDAPCEECSWTAPVEMTNPQIVTNVDGACAAGEWGFDQQTLDEMDGTRFAWGWVYEYAGHSNVLMQYNAQAGIWDAVGTADWDEPTGELWYDRSEGFCGYP